MKNYLNLQISSTRDFFQLVVLCIGYLKDLSKFQPILRVYGVSRQFLGYQHKNDKKISQPPDMVDQGLFSIGGHLSDFLCQYLVNYNDKGLIVKHMKLCRSI